jgi:hypothetical protein
VNQQLRRKDESTPRECNSCAKCFSNRLASVPKATLVPILAPAATVVVLNWASFKGKQGTNCDAISLVQSDKSYWTIIESRSLYSLFPITAQSNGRRLKRFVVASDQTSAKKIVFLLFLFRKWIRLFEAAVILPKFQSMDRSFACKSVKPGGAVMRRLNLAAEMGDPEWEDLPRQLE